ncbi:hypothetical protein COCSUDRAFT_32425, partial [Coccomyxa subellipsoidea C-169]
MQALLLLLLMLLQASLCWQPVPVHSPRCKPPQLLQVQQQERRSLPLRQQERSAVGLRAEVQEHRQLRLPRQLLLRVPLQALQLWSLALAQAVVQRRLQPPPTPVQERELGAATQSRAGVCLRLCVQRWRVQGLECHERAAQPQPVPLPAAASSALSAVGGLLWEPVTVQVRLLLPPLVLRLPWEPLQGPWAPVLLLLTRQVAAQTMLGPQLGLAQHPAEGQLRWTPAAELCRQARQAAGPAAQSRALPLPALPLPASPLPELLPREAMLVAPQLAEQKRKLP